MRLSFDDIISAMQGASYFENDNGAVMPHRFTKKQEAIYKDTDFYAKTKSAAGVVMEFSTDSRALFLEVFVEKSSTRDFFALDILCDGHLTASLNNFEDGIRPAPGTFSGYFTLPEGEKRVLLTFPWSMSALVKQISLEDGARFMPVVRKSKMLFFGDSITQGYDSRHPKNSYMRRVCDYFKIEGFNRAIGGEVFNPKLSGIREDMEPDYISVAYGCNDWSKTSRRIFEENSEKFYKNLTVNYPKAKIFAMTPIWRADENRLDRDWPFEYVEERIFEIAGKYKNVTAISCRDFVPHNIELYEDRRLHPNDEGFDFYADALIRKLKMHIGRSDCQ